MGASKGVIRRLPVGKNLTYDYIPVDIVVNNILTAGFYVGTLSEFHGEMSKSDIILLFRGDQAENGGRLPQHVEHEESLPVGQHRRPCQRVFAQIPVEIRRLVSLP